MRPIIFRGQVLGTKKWIYGRILIANRVYIVLDEMDFSSDKSCPVIKETVGQFTGLNALDGTPIYEGDIVCIRPLHDDRSIGEVFFKYGCFCLHGVGGEDDLCNYEVITVLGNIHDNPELINKYETI